MTKGLLDSQKRLSSCKPRGVTFSGFAEGSILKFHETGGWHGILIHRAGQLIRFFSKTAYYRLRPAKMTLVLPHGERLDDRIFLQLIDQLLIEVEESVSFFKDQNALIYAQMIQAKANLIAAKSHRLDPVAAREATLMASSLYHETLPIISDLGSESDLFNSQLEYATVVVLTPMRRSNEDDLKRVAMTADEMLKATTYFAKKKNYLSALRAGMLLTLFIIRLADSGDRKQQRELYLSATKSAEKTMRYYDKLPNFAKSKQPLRNLNLMIQWLFVDCHAELSEISDTGNNEETTDQIASLNMAVSLVDQVLRFPVSPDSIQDLLRYENCAGIYYRRGKHAQGAEQDRYFDQAKAWFQHVIDRQEMLEDGRSILEKACKVAHMECSCGNWTKAANYASKYLDLATTAYPLLSTYEEKRGLVNGMSALSEICAFSFLKLGQSEQVFSALRLGRSIDQRLSADPLKRLTKEQREFVRPLLVEYQKIQHQAKLLADTVRLKYDGDLSMREVAKNKILSDRLGAARKAYMDALSSFNGPSGTSPMISKRDLLAGVEAAIILGQTEFGSFACFISTDNADDEATPSMIFPNSTLASWREQFASGPDNWIESYDAFTKALAEKDSPQSHVATDAFDKVVGSQLSNLSSPLMSSLDNALSELSIEAGSRIRIIAPGRMAIAPLHAAKLSDQQSDTNFFDKWATTYSSLNVKPRPKREPRESPKKVFIVANPTGDLPEPDWQAFSNPNVDITVIRNTRNLSSVFDAAADASLVIFYCHGVWDAEDPDKSGLILSDGKALTPAQISKMHFPNQSDIVLACCESGLQNFGDFNNEQKGLPDVFLQSGARSVIASHWPIFTQIAQQLISEMLETVDSEIYDPVMFLRDFQRRRNSNDTNAEMDAPRAINYAAFSVFT